MFVDIMQRVNLLTEQPEFDHTLTNNCTTAVVQHINNCCDGPLAYSWQILLPGYSDDYAYRRGLLRNDLPFAQLKALSHVNDLANDYENAPDFSQRIRERRAMMNRLAQEYAANRIARGTSTRKSCLSFVPHVHRAPLAR